MVQARIELGEITTAVGGLLELEKRIKDDLDANGLTAPKKKMLKNELGETMGLLGRAYKQYYVNAKPSKTEPRSHDRTNSLKYYGDAYQQELGDYLWHGINYVALLTHQERIARDRHNAISREATKHAQDILDAIENKENQGPLQPWDLANLIEANLAKGDTVAAVEATKAYLDSADPFNVQSTRRQLVEVWMLTEDDPPGDEILALMDARFAELGAFHRPIPEAPRRPSNWIPARRKTTRRSGARPGTSRSIG